MENLFEIDGISEVGPALIDEVLRSYRSMRPMPSQYEAPHEIPENGCGLAGMPAIWRTITEQSAHLATPWMSGHMDTAPHPAAALTQGLVAGLNNNLLFRELSPFASQIEEQLIAFFSARLDLSDGWQGLFASGGSLANLTALFAAVGGFSADEDRDRFHLLMPESGHLSLSKSAIVLGIGASRIHKLTCDEAGRIDCDALRLALGGLPVGARPIVASVLGTTIHGSVDDIEGISALCREYNAWHHVDAIYGAALAVSGRFKDFLTGLDDANSIVLGPQKWMYVPRVSAITLIKGKDLFDQRLGSSLPYSLGEQEHRGRWGIQGSRPADAVVLWATLHAIGIRALGDAVDHAIDLARAFHVRLTKSEILQPTHIPDLNLQVFRVKDADHDGHRLGEIQRRLSEGGRTWMSVSRWRSETFLRAVLLSPSLTTEHLDAFVSDVEALA
ncbi:MAG: aspartate aminotransferase family protein [Rhodobacter sp.]|nr:aspartate aminotransferase family protein [Rhodobacter sp.]